VVPYSRSPPSPAPKPPLFMFALVLPRLGSPASGSPVVLIALAIKRAVARTLEIGRAVAAMVGIGAEAWLVVLVVAIVELGIDAE